MTARDSAANTVLPLLSLDAPRADTPATLAAPESSPAVGMQSLPPLPKLN